MKNQQFDAIIIGGGCSGLSLALALSQKKPQQSILILESRTHYVSDRTWCYWNIQSHPFESLVRKRWKRWQVRWGGQTLHLRSVCYEYHCIPSLSFYEEATQQIKNLKHVTLLMDARLENLIERPTEITVATTQGTFTCSQAYDGRPPPEKSPLYQHFHGWEIVVERPIFNPEEVILMDFDGIAREGLNFIYLLPFTPYRALVESTYLSPHVHKQEVYEEDIRNYLKERYGVDSFKIIHRETGALPLQCKTTNSSSSKVIPIGLKGGWIRPSTGYAFLPIQKGVEKLFKDQTMKKNVLEQRLDQLFLSYIQDHPEHAPEIFFNLFKKNSADCMVRFLMSRWTYQDLLKVILSMPKLTMLRRILR